jgi:hypothetical protein
MKKAPRNQGMTPKSDPNFPMRLLLVNGFCKEKARAYVERFNLGTLPSPLNIREPKLRNLIAVLITHYRYGNLKDANRR